MAALQGWPPGHTACMCACAQAQLWVLCGLAAGTCCRAGRSPWRRGSRAGCACVGMPAGEGGLARARDCACRPPAQAAVQQLRTRGAGRAAWRRGAGRRSRSGCWLQGCARAAGCAAGAPPAAAAGRARPRLGPPCACTRGRAGAHAARSSCWAGLRPPAMPEGEQRAHQVEAGGGSSSEQGLVGQELVLVHVQVLAPAAVGAVAADVQVLAQLRAGEPLSGMDCMCSQACCRSAVQLAREPCRALRAECRARAGCWATRRGAG